MPQAITGKFLPLDQWLYFDALECLTLEGVTQLTEEDCVPVRACTEGDLVPGCCSLLCSRSSSIPIEGLSL